MSRSCSSRCSTAGSSRSSAKQIFKEIGVPLSVQLYRKRAQLDAVAKKAAKQVAEESYKTAVLEDYDKTIEVSEAASRRANSSAKASRSVIDQSRELTGNYRRQIKKINAACDDRLKELQDNSTPCSTLVQIKRH